MLAPRKSSIRLLAMFALALITTAMGRSAQGQDKLTTLAQFTGTNGAQPNSGLVLDSAGNLYGTTAGGGANDSGVIYKVSPQGVATVLYNFPEFTDVFLSKAPLAIDSQGNLYGTTPSGGMHDAGSVYKVAPDGTYSSLYDFASTAEDGEGPEFGVTLDAQGNLYGTTVGGGAFENGTIFKITAGGTYSTVFSFPVAVGTVNSGVISDANANLYGSTFTTSDPSNNGRVYRVSSGRILTTLHTFSVLEGPGAGNLTLDADGNLYGSTRTFPGTLGAVIGGTIFKIAPGGRFTTLRTFFGLLLVDDELDLLFFGEQPTGALTLDAQGNVFGTTSGSYDFNLGDVAHPDQVMNTDTVPGTAFRIGAGGTFTTLARLTDGAGANDSPAIDGSGNVYGTQQQGTSTAGVVFKLSPRP